MELVSFEDLEHLGAFTSAVNSLEKQAEDNCVWFRGIKYAHDARSAISKSVFKACLAESRDLRLKNDLLELYTHCVHEMLHLIDKKAALENDILVMKEEKDDFLKFFDLTEDEYRKYHEFRMEHIAGDINMHDPNRGAPT